VDLTPHLLGQDRIHEALPLDRAQPGEALGDHHDVVVAAAAGTLVAAVLGGVVAEGEVGGCQRVAQLALDGGGGVGGHLLDERLGHGGSSLLDRASIPA
jgi:hypothetical protein